MRPAVKIALVVAALVVLVFFVCPSPGTTTDEMPPVHPPEAPPDDGTGLRFGSAWWEAAAPCPDGAVLRGAPPPSGRDIWCELPDGVRHGPHAAWWPNGRQHLERSYDHGRLDGTFRKWRPSGRRWAAGEYREGVRTGRWVEWSDFDRAEITDYE